MTFKLLETVVLKRDLPDAGLMACDLGTIVELYPPDGVEVEFITAGGRTRALVTLRTEDVRSVTVDDLMSVRPLTPVK